MKKILAVVLLAGILLLGCGGLEGSGTPIKDKDAVLEAIQDPGVDLQCTFKGTVEGYKVNMKFWRKGESLAIDGSETSDNGALQIKMMTKDGYVYLGGQPGKGDECDWVKLKTTASKSEAKFTDTSSLEAFIEKGIKYECLKGGFGNEVFDTPGKVCGEKDLARSLQQGQGSEENVAAEEES